MGSRLLLRVQKRWLERDHNASALHMRERIGLENVPTYCSTGTIGPVTPDDPDQAKERYPEPREIGLLCRQSFLRRVATWHMASN